MVKQTIKIYCRIKPTKQATGIYELDTLNEREQDCLSIFVPKDAADGYINNKKENYKFSFDHIFDQKTKQDAVFSQVAKPVVDNAMSGFNGTIFAYGQTGSGKTFTITGGAERYVDRGIIPRALSYIFQKSCQDSNLVYTIHVSYLEIYNESGYDLLDPKHEASKLEDLPKVSLLEDTDGNIHLKHLSMHQANNEEEALNLLFLGDTNRMIAETPMNQASTRSHCIFTIHMSARETDSATIRKSKLHLVDLAGSERVSKTGVGGTLLKEAKYINLSLHHLELVIIALSEKSRSHIPYRTSMMTSVLRDSLGGNCMTSMIATCSVERRNMDESISTCRFAQRVALIKNDAILNEELDPQLLIAKLKSEVQQLKDELSLLKGEQYDDGLTDEDKEKVRAMVRSYIEDQDKEASLSVGADMRKITFCFQVMKDFCMNNLKERKGTPQVNKSPQLMSRNSPTSSNTVVPEQVDPIDNSYLSKTNELQKLKALILQRDNEINILVGMLKKEKERTETRTRSSNATNGFSFSADSVRSSRSYDERHYVKRDEAMNARDEQEKRSPPQQHNMNAKIKSLNKKNKAAMSIARQQAFESFVRDHNDNKLIEENKKGLKMRYTEAKKLGEQVNSARHAINTLKGKLEKLSIRKSLQAAAGTNIAIEDEKEGQLRNELDQYKNSYKSSFNQLKALKTEIEHMQFLLEKSKTKLQKEFDIWWNIQVAGAQENNRENQMKTAWKTPPVTPNTISDQHNTSTTEINNQSRMPQNSHNAFLSSHQEKSGSREKTITSLDSIDSVRTSSKLSIRLTGDTDTDADIMAFIRARQELSQKARR